MSNVVALRGAKRRPPTTQNRKVMPKRRSNADLRTREYLTPDEVELAEDVVPDETTILRFRHLLEAHRLTEAIFAEVRTLLEERGLLLKSGTIVDATIINCHGQS
jgi:IS5 family transposase